MYNFLILILENKVNKKNHSKLLQKEFPLKMVEITFKKF